MPSDLVVIVRIWVFFNTCRIQKEIKVSLHYSSFGPTAFLFV